MKKYYYEIIKNSRDMSIFCTWHTLMKMAYYDNYHLRSYLHNIKNKELHEFLNENMATHSCMFIVDISYSQALVSVSTV